MNYIGIRGHRGAGKDLVSYVIGNTLDFIINNNQIPEQSVVNEWIDEIIANENIIHEISLNNIYFDSFGDTVKTFVALLLGCNPSYLYDDYYKDHIVVNLGNFECTEYETLPQNIELVNNEVLAANRIKFCNADSGLSNCYMSLRNFILYFGQDVMKRFFGVDVWIKTLNANNATFTNIFDDKSYKIFRDIKTSSEITYIKKHKGVIIKINRKNPSKKNGMDKLSKDRRFDYLIEIPEDVHLIYEDIINICKNILNKNGKESEKN